VLLGCISVGRACWAHCLQAWTRVQLLKQLKTLPDLLLHRFSEQHGFKKPNDKRALDLMDACAKVKMFECEPQSL